MMRTLNKNIYQECPLPKNLTFDEESLFWRLRMGEGLPQRVWHKPLDKSKSWHEIKLNLDKKLADRSHELFQKVYPCQNQSIIWQALKKIIHSIKISFLLTD